MPGQVKTSPEWDLPLEQHQEARRIIQRSQEAGGMPPEEIAAAMGLSVVRVEAILRAGMKAFRKNAGPAGLAALRECLRP